MSYLIIEGLHKKYGQATVLSNIQMNIQKGEFITLLGPSGCGKSTILRIVAGLTDASSGRKRYEWRTAKGSSSGHGLSILCTLS